MFDLLSTTFIRLVFAKANADEGVLNDCLNTYGWDAYGRPTTVDSVAITYDASGRMVEQDNSGAYTQIYYSPSGFKMMYMNGSVLVKNTVPTGGPLHRRSRKLLALGFAGAPR